MSERPILFSAPMVRALLDGSKTQTRRLVKDQKNPDFIRLHSGGTCGWNGNTGYALSCPYGQPGDRLWVRETLFAYGRWETRYSEKKRRDEWHFIDMTLECDRAYQYAADNPDVPLAKGRGAMPGWWKRPAIHMPRVVSRICRDVVSVRVERLNDISEVDAEAEGIRRWYSATSDPVLFGINSRGCGFGTPGNWHFYSTAVRAYQALWEAINGPGSWAANPWVWVVEFKRVQP